MRIAEFPALHSQFRISLDRECPRAAKRVDESCTICELIFWKSLIEKNEKYKSTQNGAETMQKWFHRESSEFRISSFEFRVSSFEFRVAYQCSPEFYDFARYCVV